MDAMSTKSAQTSVPASVEYRMLRGKGDITAREMLDRIAEMVKEEDRKTEITE